MIRAAVQLTVGDQVAENHPWVSSRVEQMTTSLQVASDLLTSNFDELAVLIAHNQC